MAEHGGDVGNRRMAEFECVRAHLIAVDRVRSEVRREYEYVGAGTGIEDIVRSADQARGGGASGERLTTQVPIQHGGRDYPVAVQVLVETGLERLQRSASSRHSTD